MRKYSKETTVGIFVVIGLIAIGYLTIKLGDVSFLGDNTYPLYARFSSVTGLRTGSAVNMFGLEIGKVGILTIDQDKQQAVAEFRISKGIKIYQDAIASIKTEGLIGDKFVSIDPGGSEAVLKPGAAIVDTQSPTDLMDLISKYAFGDVKK
jgi:phospholipid/cholesterol/gamma-HCH transport system substrate-binding protein